VTTNISVGEVGVYAKHRSPQQPREPGVLVGKPVVLGYRGNPIAKRG
jgi:hypothetical protein